MASILVVDDSEATRAQVRRALRGDGTFDRFLEAEDGLSAFKLLVDEKPNLVLCDLNMPRFDGQGFLRLRASRPELRDIPVIMLAAEGDGEMKARLIENGACDYLTKPFHEKELLVRVRLHHRMKTLQDELRDANARLEALSNTDPLTGLANRRCLERRLSDEIARARRHGVALTVVALDIDHFKSVNDKHGHDMGDIVLRNVARAMAEGLRSNDVAARPGGEEFLLLLPHTDLAGGVAMAERVRARLERLPHVGPGATLRVTASFGVACTASSHTVPTGEELLARADQALYEAKRSGRNRVVAWSAPAPDGAAKEAATLAPPPATEGGLPAPATKGGLPAAPGPVCPGLRGGHQRAPALFRPGFRPARGLAVDAPGEPREERTRVTGSASPEVTPAPEGHKAEAPAAPPRATKPRRAPAVAGLALAALAGSAALAYEVDEASARSKVGRGVVLSGAKLGGLEGPALEAEVERFAAAFAARRLALRAGSYSDEASMAERGALVDVPATAAAALRAGREGAWPSRWASWLSSLARPRQLGPVVRLDEALVEANFDALDRSMPERPFAGAVRAPGGVAQAEYPRPGSLVDRPAARTLLLARLPLGDASLALPLQARPAPLTREAVDEALARARRVLSGPAALATADGSRRVEWTPAELGAALESRPAPGGEPRLDLAFSAGAIEAKLAPLRASLDEAPVDARFEAAGDRVSLVPGREGRRLDAPLAAEALLRAAEAGGREGALPYGPGDAPALSTEAAEALRVTKLVAAFTTRHGCCEPRVQNIHRIADLVDGALVRPGEAFSVNERVGPRTAERGFVFAPSIAEHETVETIGGGVSQFATTLFNALIDGGYEIVERQPHSFYFSRYPKGHEATLSFPKPDLIFRNDTGAGVLIKVEYGKDYVRVRLFGDNGGRKVERKVSPDFDFRDPPVEYEPNSGVAPDEEKVVAPGARGWSVLASRVITYSDGTSKEEKRKVTYMPRPRRVDVHPCRLPKGARGYTGRPCPRPEAPPLDAGAVEAASAPAGEVP